MKKFILMSLFILTLSPSLSFAASNSVIVNVSGLVCDFCARAVEKLFSKQEEIDSVKVDLDKKTITLLFKGDKKLDDTKIADLITQSGYEVVSIIRDEVAK